MKLSKKNQARQRAIAKMVSSGKALGGLLAGLVATVIPGCRDNSPATPMGDVPCTQQEQKPNSGNEKHGRNPAVRGKYLIEPEKPNETNEKSEDFITAGVMLPETEPEPEPKPNAKNEKKPVFEEGGDIQVSDE